MSNEFWMVYNPQGGAPTYQHSSFQQAKAEAERLARMNPGQSFYVLQACGMARKVDVEWVNINIDNVPF